MSSRDRSCHSVSSTLFLLDNTVCEAGFVAVSRPSPATPPLSPPPPPPPRLSPATPCASGLSSSSLHRLGLGLAQRAGAVGRTEAHLCRRQLSPRLAATRPSGPAAKPLRAWRLGHLRLLWRPRPGAAALLRILKLRAPVEGGWRLQLAQHAARPVVTVAVLGAPPSCLVRCRRRRGRRPAAPRAAWSQARARQSPRPTRTRPRKPRKPRPALAPPARLPDRSTTCPTRPARRRTGARRRAAERRCPACCP